MIRRLISLTTAILLLAGNMTNNNAASLVGDFRKDTGCKAVSAVIYSKGEEDHYGESDALYQIGSMTKAFTGLAIQKLIDEGRLAKDDTVDRYIEGFEVFFDSQKVSITVDDLLSQKSGFTNSEKDYPSSTEDMTLIEWANSMSGKELKCKPGTEYNYSNANFDLLGAMIEKITGLSYRDYMTGEILTPLGLYDTYVGVPDSKDRIIEGSRLCYRTPLEYSVPVREGSIPAGYFYSSGKDMSRWLKIWLGDEQIDTEFVLAIEHIKYNLKEEGDYYAGWELFENGVIGHSGGTPNYSSRIVFSDKDDTGVCVLTNLNVAASTDSLCNGIFERACGRADTGIVCDIWTVFDKIFTAVTVGGFFIAVVLLIIRNKRALLITGVVIAVLVALMVILFPIIFGAGLKDILLVWAPWSMAGGMLILLADIAVAILRLCSVRVNESRKKTS